MGLQQNMSDVMRALKEHSRKSMQEFSKELEISRSALQEYLNGTGNPRLATVDHLAKKLDIDPVFLVSGMFEHSQLEIIMLLLDTIKEVSSLPQGRRKKFAELFLWMISLWETEQ